MRPSRGTREIATDCHALLVTGRCGWAATIGRDGSRADQHAEALAAEGEVDIEFVRKTDIRKEDLVEKVLARRGREPGLVHILSAMESCTSYQPWHDKQTGKTYLRPDSGKCLHYYFYFTVEELGLCYLRVPTWAPFRMQFYWNGHN